MSHLHVDNCYDSHVHWMATGQLATRLLLHHLPSAEAIRQVKIEAQHFSGEWLIGFGWDNSKWSGQEYPHRHLLDELFPDFPVSLSRVDGHAVWVNSLALQKLGVVDAAGKTIKIPELSGGRFVVDSFGNPTGVLIDLAKSMIDRMIPEPDAMQIRGYLLKGIQKFNRAGITHIRDMSCSETQWGETVHLAEAGMLSLAVEQTFSAEDPNDFDQALALAKRARQQKLPMVRAQALKIYYDGALGSEGALISEDYLSGSGRGLELLTKSELQGYMRRSWEGEFDIAVHTIGDEAAHRTILAAEELWEKGLKGKLHLEHAQMLRPETIDRMRPDRVVCHIQPCHWLSDRRWLKGKLGTLYRYVFPWRALQESDIPFFFGSDSPIESTSIKANLLALEESPMHDIPSLLGDPLRYHSHPDKSWVPNCFTHFVDGEPTSVVYRGTHLL